MQSRAGAGGGCGHYIASLLNSSPRLDFGVLGGMPVLDGVVAAAASSRGGDCLEKFWFAEQVAWLSSFNRKRFTGAVGLFGMPPPAPATSNGEFEGGGGGSREASSVSDLASVMKDANAKKRKAPAAKGKGKEPSLSTSCHVGEQKESDAKRCKMEEGEKKESPVKPEQARSDSSIEDGGQK